MQANQQTGAERRSESAMVCAGDAGMQKLYFLDQEEFVVAAHPAVCPTVWPGRGPPGERSSIYVYIQGFVLHSTLARKTSYYS